MSNTKHVQAQMDNMRTQVEQLRLEAAAPRIKVSEAAQILIDFCEKNRTTDALVNGISDSHNPFQEKKSCTIL